MSGKRVRFRDLPEQKQRAVKRTAFAVAAFLVATGGLSLLVGGPLLRFIGDPAQFRAWVDAHGFWGRAAFVGMVFTQVVLAVLPGEPLEIAAGYAFGFWEGTLLCLVGISSASLLIFLFVRRFGMRTVRVFFSEEQIASVHFLHDRRRLTLLTLILFLIPGTPKDVMTYCVGLTEMKLSTWMAIATLARIHRHLHRRRQRAGRAGLPHRRDRVCGHGGRQHRGHPRLPAPERAPRRAPGEIPIPYNTGAARRPAPPPSV